MCSPFTLYKPCLLLMYDIRYSLMLIHATRKMCLQKNYQAIQAKNPTMSHEDIIGELVKYTLPKTLTRSSSWHWSQLSDLMAMVDMYGLLFLFLTLTCDETSELRWDDIEDLEKIIQKLGNNFSWKDCRVECTHLFHTRVKEFLYSYIIWSKNLQGKVEYYMIRYEVRERISLHAQIIFGLHKDDVQSVTDKIMANAPAKYDEIEKCYIERKDDIWKRLFQLVKRKQLHICKVDKDKCFKGNKKCKYRFVFKINLITKAKVNAYTRWWEYYRPRYSDQNVVSYQGPLFSIWEAHMNIQHITSSFWSLYLLKYTMKIELVCAIKFDKRNTKRLGLSILKTILLKSITRLLKWWRPIMFIK